MPIYEYRCANCDRSFEAFVRPSDTSTQCPHCNGSKVTREMSTFASRSNRGGRRIPKECAGRVQRSLRFCTDSSNRSSRQTCLVVVDATSKPHTTKSRLNNSAQCNIPALYPTRRHRAARSLRRPPLGQGEVRKNKLRPIPEGELFSLTTPPTDMLFHKPWTAVVAL